MPIVFTRIDNRLIHGQIGKTWMHHLGVQLIVVANDKVAEDAVQQNLMNMAVPKSARTLYFTLQEAIDQLPGVGQDVFLVVRTPQDALRLAEGGVSIASINIGNMHAGSKKRQVTSTVAVDAADRAAIRQLLDRGIKMEIRRVPDEAATDIQAIFREWT